MDENQRPFLQRFWIYQKERFPFFAHGLMIGAFTFSAVSYSRICSRKTGFIPWSDFAIGILATISLFFLVRIFDEFKDREDDARFRKYLPVPRGLISLKELKWIGILVGLFQISAIVIFQREMLLLYLIVLAYLVLMGFEFFVSKWLKSRQLLYITSHMFIIPLIDIYASGLDWKLEGSSAHWGLAWFFAVSYMNGLVLEFGRKLRSPEMEEDGVISYTGLYGTKGGVIAWIVLMFITMLLAMGAAWYADYSYWAYIIFGGFFIICALPGFQFLVNVTAKGAKRMEYSSAIWTALMYLALGGIPMLISLWQ